MQKIKQDGKEGFEVKGYEVGKLTIVVQAIKDSTTGKLIKGVFCNLKIRKDGKDDALNFVFSLESIPSFKKHIVCNLFFQVTEFDDFKTRCDYSIHDHMLYLTETAHTRHRRYVGKCRLSFSHTRTHVLFLSTHAHTHT